MEYLRPMEGQALSHTVSPRRDLNVLSGRSRSSAHLPVVIYFTPHAPKIYATRSNISIRANFRSSSCERDCSWILIPIPGPDHSDSTLPDWAAFPLDSCRDLGIDFHRSCQFERQTPRHPKTLGEDIVATPMMGSPTHAAVVPWAVN
jgi:hypothetical protein